MWVNRGLVLFNELSQSARSVSQHSLATARPFILLGFDQITQLAIATLHWSLILLSPLFSPFAKHARFPCVTARGRKGERICTWFSGSRMNPMLSSYLSDPHWVISPLFCGSLFMALRSFKCGNNCCCLWQWLLLSCLRWLWQMTVVKNTSWSQQHLKQ